MKKKSAEHQLSLIIYPKLNIEMSEMLDISEHAQKFHEITIESEIFDR